MLVWPAVSFSTRPVHPLFLGGKVPTTLVRSSASHSALRLPTCTRTARMDGTHLIFSFAAACPPLPSPFATNEEGSEGIERRGARAGSRRYLLLRGALLLVAVGVLLRRRGRRRRRRGAAGEQERPAAANAADDGASDKARLRLAAPQEDAAAGREHVLRRTSHLSLVSSQTHTQSSSREQPTRELLLNQQRLSSSLPVASVSRREGEK